MFCTMFHKSHRSKRKVIKTKKRFIKSSIFLILIEYLYILTCLRTSIYDTFLLQIPILFFYYKINFIKKRKRKGVYLLFLFILPYTSFLIEDKITITSKKQDLNYTFWVESYNIPYEDELIKLKSKNVDFLIPISTSTLNDIGFFYGGNESFSYEDVGEEENIKWVDSKYIYGNCSIKIVKEYENHGNVLEIQDKDLKSYCIIRHNYNYSLINKTIEFWIGSTGGCSAVVSFGNSEREIESLAFTSKNIWKRINITDWDVVFNGVDSYKKLLHIKILFSNYYFNIYLENIYLGTSKYSCLFDNYTFNKITYMSLSTFSFQESCIYFDAIGTTGDISYKEGQNLHPYKSIIDNDYPQFQRLNDIGIKYSLCLMVNDYAFLDNGETLLSLLKSIRNYDFYKTASEIFIDAEISKEIREKFTLNTIPSNNKYRDGLEIYNDIKEIIKEDGKEFGIIRGPTASMNINKAIRNVPFDELGFDLSVIMLYRTYENIYQKNSDYWFYQSVKREKGNIFIGSLKKGYSDLRKDLTICSSLGKERIFIYEYESFSDKYDLDDLKPYKRSITIQKKCENYEYFIKFLGLECLNFLLLFHFIYTN